LGSAWLRPGKLKESLPSKKIKDKRDEHADENASRDWEVKGKALALDRNVAWQISQPGQSAGEHKYNADDRQQ
jgi:hypothetical protein